MSLAGAADIRPKPPAGRIIRENGKVAPSTGSTIYTPHGGAGGSGQVTVGLFSDNSPNLWEGVLTEFDRPNPYHEIVRTGLFSSRPLVSGYGKAVVPKAHLTQAECRESVLKAVEWWPNLHLIVRAHYEANP